MIFVNIGICAVFAVVVIGFFAAWIWEQRTDQRYYERRLKEKS